MQQDLGFGLGRADPLFPDSTIDRLVDFLRQRREGDIYIVLSNPGALGKSGSTYSNDVSLEAFAQASAQECSGASRSAIRSRATRSGAGPIR